MSLWYRRLCLIGALVLLSAFVPAARFALAATITVSNLNDTGAGSLRAAITQANASAGNDTIIFSVSGTITVASPLPPLTDASGVTIDGSSSSGPKVPLIEIRGYNGVSSVTGPGIDVQSSNNVIRGLAISGFRVNAGRTEFTGAGIAVNGKNGGAPLTNNLIEYCYVGTDLAGSAAGPGGGFNNPDAGIILEYGAQGTTVQHNVISGNFGQGIYLFSDPGLAVAQQNNNNSIHDNYIGLNAAGSAALPNGLSGVFVGDSSNNNVIGPGNVISGNGGRNSGARYGVFISSGNNVTSGFISANVVKGNLIGTGITGSTKIPNTSPSGFGGAGVGIGQSQGTVIGGPNAADGNVISGNQEFGIAVLDTTLPASTVGTSNISIQNNKIGVAADGVTGLGNTQGGVLIWKKASGVTLGPGNVIASNPLDGVRIIGVANTTDATVQTRNISITGNAIGTNAGGTLSLPNGRAGVLLEGATSGNNIANNSIFNNASSGISLQFDTGSTPLAPRQNTIGSNQVKSNGGVGIALTGASTNNTISGNTIASNGALGIQMVGSSSSNTINGGNTITGHSEAGIQIETSSNTVNGNTVASNQIGINITNGATNNTISANHLNTNTLHGVFVSGAGVVGNRITQTTTDSNNGKGIALASGGNLGDQAGRPGLSGVAFSGAPPKLSGTVTNGGSCGGAGCTVEVFGADSAQTDEGPVYLGTFTSSGSFSNVSLASCKPFMIFTLTDNAGNTSEFTSPIAAPLCVPAAPVVTLSDATPSPTQSALAGQTRVFTHIVSNTGTGGGALTISASPNNGWTTVLDKSACPATLAAGASCTITLSVTVPGGATAGQSNSTTITASIQGAAASAQKTDVTTVLVQPALSLTPSNQTKSTGPGQPVSFTHTLTNQGNGADSFTITVVPPAGWTYSVQPAGSIALAQNASAQVTVTYTPTAGIASPPNYVGQVTARSNADTNVSATVTDTITIISAAVPQITSTVTPASADPGALVTIDYTITNVGNLTGTFALSFSGPSGWTIGTAVPATVTLGPGASKPVSTTLTVPAGAIAGAYSASLTATDQAAPATKATKADTITVKQRAALTLDPDQSFTRNPNATYTDTLTLTNGGNFTDTISLATSSSRGWPVRALPPSVTLNPGASTQVKLETTIPPGQLAGTVGTSVITATSSLPAVHDSALITNTIASVPGVAITPASQQRAINAGKSATYGFTLVNSGSVAQSFTIALANVPAGWGATLAPTSTVSLAPGATVPLSLTLTAPAGATNGTTASVTLAANCVEATCTASALAIARVGPPIDTQIGQDCSQSALPGALIICRHSITNTGSIADTFALTLTSRLGWGVTYVPSTVFLDPGASKTFTVTLQVPTSAPGQVLERLKITARSVALPSVTKQVTDTITVLQFGAASLVSEQTRVAKPGVTVTFNHTLQNLGNGLDSFTITATQTLGWQITLVPTQTTTLAPGLSYPVQLKVQVPADAPPSAINRITLRATSVLTPTAFAELTDIVGTPPPPTHLYLPLVSRE